MSKLPPFAITVFALAAACGLEPIPEPSGTGSFCGVFGAKCACPPSARRFWDRHLASSAVRAAPGSVVDPNPARFDSEIAAFEKWDHQNAFPRDAVLFVGSSTIRRWQTADSFPDLPVINRGFGGSHISDANHFFDRIVAKYRPRVIVFYSGDNDTAFGKSPDKVFGDFQSFANRVHKELPHTRLIYLAIKPSPARWKLWPNMQSINARVKELSQQPGWLTFVDTAPSLLGPDGQPRPELFRNDGLHLNGKGYRLWAPLVRTAVERALESPAR